MGKVKINRDDINRILLTELLPYEVPMLFSNEGFYAIILKKQHETLLERVSELSKVPYGIPFNYEIGKSTGGDTRTLSVIHPCSQLNYVDLYRKYDSLMLHLCSKSPFSLRKISKVARFYYSPNFVFDEDPHKSAELEVEPDILEIETKYLKSYFTYKPIDLIYKFYDRMEFRRLEQRFNLMMEFDISRCFYHIYTHSITWAVKDKASSKRNAKATSFENLFDQCMQKSNYNETNGIVVGPEISRIFAEIILQRVDIDTLKDLSNESINLKYGVDYEVKRYVDDYFIFANSESALLKIKEVFQKNLAFYKLYLNQSKTSVKAIPFITNTTVAKREVESLLNSFWNSLITENEEEQKIIFSVRKPYGASQNFIKDFQCIVKKNCITYDIVSKDVVRYLKRKIVHVLKNDIYEKEGSPFEDFLITFFDVLLYCYSLYINSNTTFRIAQTIILICRYFEINKSPIKHSVFSKISQDIDFALTNFQRKSKTHNSGNIEMLNLLIALKKLDESYHFTEKRLKVLFDIENTPDYLKLNYFQIVTLLYYIEDRAVYSEIKQNIEDAIFKKIDEEEDLFAKSEFVMLFFDLICCPFISNKMKNKLITVTNFCKKGERNADKIKEISDKKKWFMDWDTDIDLERILKKKEWTSSY